MSFIHYLESIIGVDIYAIIAFFLFFGLFIIMAIWAWKADKKLLDEINRLPLDN
jgi:hypothetical protein